MKARLFLSIVLFVLGSNPSFGDEPNRVAIKPLRTMGSLHLKHDWRITSLACSPKGNYLASNGGDKFIRLWDTKTLQLVWEVKTSWDDLDRLVFSPDGEYLAFPSKNVWVLIEVSSGKRIPFIKPLATNEHFIVAVAFSPDGKWIAFGELVKKGNDHVWQISVWDFKKRKEISTFTDIKRETEFWNLSFSPDSTYLAARYKDREITVWNLQNGKKEYEITHKASVLAVEFSPKGNFLMTLDDEGAYLQDPKSGKVIRTIESPKREHYRCAPFSPDETLLATGNSRSGDIVLWNLETGKVVQTLHGHTCSTDRACDQLCFSPDGKRLYSGGRDGTIRVWDLKSGKELFPREDHVGAVYTCTFSPDGSFFLSGGFDGIIRKWDTQTGKLLERIPLVCSNPFEILDLTTTNEFYAVSTMEAGEQYFFSIQVGNLKTKQVKVLFREERKPIRSIHFREDSKNTSLFAFLSDGDVLSWSSDFSSKQKVLGSPTEDCFPSFVNWEGREVSALYWKKPDLIWVNRLNPKKPTRSLFTLDHLPSFILSPNERYLLTFDTSEGLVLWTTNPQQTKKKWEWNVRFANWIQFSPDSRYFVASHDDIKVSIYETASRNHLFDLDGHRASTKTLAFSPDNRFVLTGSADSRLMLWDLRSFGEAEQEEITDKDLTEWWKDLQNENPPIALKAVSRMVQSSTKSMAYLKTHLKPIESLSDEKVNQLICKLDHANFAVRKKAFQELDENSEFVEERLQKELKATPSFEVQNAITRLLENLKKSRSYPNGNALRQIRAVQALEYIGTEEAKSYLGSLSKGAPKAMLTQEAQEAFERMERQRTKRGEK